MDRTITSRLAANTTNMCFSQGIPIRERVVGRPRSLEQLDEEASDGDVSAFVEGGDVAARCLDSTAWWQRVNLLSFEGLQYSSWFYTHLRSVP
jgi:hypothetical protein